MQFIRMIEELDELGCHQYEVQSDLRGYIKQDPTFVKHCKKLAKEKQFAPSHEVLQMINFRFLKKVSSEKRHKLPDKFTKFVKDGI